MRRFLLHVLPRAFVKVRHFGLYAAGNVNSKLAVARAWIEDRDRRPGQDLQQQPAAPLAKDVAALDWRTLFQKLTGIDLGVCPGCGGTLTIDIPLDAKQSARAPPLDSS
jgi:hypothetical protein